MNSTMKSIFALAALVVPAAAIAEEVVLPVQIPDQPVLRKVVEPGQPAPAAQKQEAAKPAPAPAPIVQKQDAPKSAPAPVAVNQKPDAVKEALDEMSKAEKPQNENKWQFSIGCEYRPGVKAKFNFIPSRYNAGRVQTASMAYQGLSSASSAAKNGDYDDGYVHTDSGTKLDGDTSAWSANDWSQYNGGDGTVSFSSTYSVSQSTIKSPTEASVEEEEDMPGITFDLSRDIYANGAFKLGLTLGFSYVMEKDMVDFGHNFALGSSSSSVRKIVDTYDVSYWAGMKPDELKGGGDRSTGALIPATPASSSDVVVSGGSTVTYDGGSDVSADFKMYEARLSLEPEYEVTDWFSIFGQVGVAAGQGIVSWESTSWFRGNSRNTISVSGEEKDTFVQGFAGIGLRVMPFENFGISLFGDYRFGKGEIDVEAGPYVGKIETGELRVGAALTLAF